MVVANRDMVVIKDTVANKEEASVEFPASVAKAAVVVMMKDSATSVAETKDMEVIKEVDSKVFKVLAAHKDSVS